MSSSKCLSLLLIVLLSAACSGIAARGRVGGQTIDTRVDSEVARYYLASYLAGERGDAALDERIDHIYRSANGSVPDRRTLKDLSDDFSPDFASLYLADQIARSPGNRRFQDAFERVRDYTRNNFRTGRIRLPPKAADFEVVFVPGYLYKRVKVTGADFAVPRAALQRAGILQHFVETHEDAAVEENADLVAAAIRARAQTGHRLILISASKSGPEVALALTKLAPAETRTVAAWINAVGALQGTPLADERSLPEVERLGKVNSAGMESLATERSRRRFEAFRIPEHIFVVNYIGIPVTGSISSLGNLGFSSLRKYGPNDGITLLADSIFPSGLTVVELGRDHFLLDVEMDVTTVALTNTIISWIEQQ